MYEVKEGKLVLKHGIIKQGLIAVASGKGGVGKSTVTVNLALALQQQGHQVGIIDADIHGFSIPRIIGLKDKPMVYNEKEIVPPAEKGIKVMSIGSFVQEADPVIWRAPLLMGVLQQFMEDVHWEELDYLLLDLPPGTGDMALNIIQRLPHTQMLVVTTPQITATQVAGRIAKVAERLDAELLGVIENMSFYQCPHCAQREYIFGQGGGKKLAAQLKTELLGELPLLPAIREGGDVGNPLVLSLPDSEATAVYLDIAGKIRGRVKEFDSAIKPIVLKEEPGK